MPTDTAPPILPVEAYEHYEAEYIYNIGFRVFARRARPAAFPALPWGRRGSACF